MTNEEKAALVATAGKRLAGVMGLESVVVQWPTPGDQFDVDERMEAIAQRECVSPLRAVHAVPESELGGEDRLRLLSMALDRAAGGGVAPSLAAVNRAYNSLEGLRYRLWRLTRRTQPALTEADFERLVTPENRPDVIDALNGLLKALDPNSTARPGAG